VGRRGKASRTRRGREHHKTRTRATSGNRQNQRDRTSSKRGRTGAGNSGNREHHSARRRGADKRISTASATDRNRATSGQHRRNHARHQRAERRGQPATTREPDHRHHRGGGEKGKGRRHYAPQTSGSEATGPTKQPASGATTGNPGQAGRQTSSERPQKGQEPANKARRRSNKRERRRATATKREEATAHPLSSGGTSGEHGGQAPRGATATHRHRRRHHRNGNRETARNGANTTAATRRRQPATPRNSETPGGNRARKPHDRNETRQGTGGRTERHTQSATRPRREPTTGGTHHRRRNRNHQRTSHRTPPQKPTANEGSHPPPPPPGAAEAPAGSGRQGREGTPNPTPPAAAPEGASAQSRKRRRAQGREAGSAATEPLSPGVSERHKRKKPPGATRGKANEESAKARDGGGTGAAPPKKTGILLFRVLLTAIRPPRRDAPGRHGERWNALRGGTRRVFRDSGRRYAARAMEGHGWDCGDLPVVALGERARRERAAPQGCALLPVVGECRSVGSDSSVTSPHI